jgi:hypothetical protein
MSKSEDVTTDRATTSATTVWFFSQSFVVTALSYLILWVSIIAGSVPNWDAGGPQLDMMIITLLFNVALGGSANGFFVASYQEKILKRAGYQIAQWKRYTTIGFTTGWFAFFVAQYVSSFQSGEYQSFSFYERSLLSSLFGLSVAGLQWLGMRKHSPQAFHWFWTMALSWTIGLYLLFPLFGLPQEFWGMSPQTGLIPGFILASVIPAMIHSLLLLTALRLMKTQFKDPQT